MNFRKLCIRCGGLESISPNDTEVANNGGESTAETNSYSPSSFGYSDGYALVILLILLTFLILTLAFILKKCGIDSTETGATALAMKQTISKEQRLALIENALHVRPFHYPLNCDDIEANPMKDAQSSMGKLSIVKDGQQHALFEEGESCDDAGNTSHSRNSAEASHCAVCLSAFHEGTPVCSSPYSSCDHCYHKECIIPWLENHVECPCCRCKYIDPDELLKSRSIISEDVEPATCMGTDDGVGELAV